LIKLGTKSTATENEHRDDLVCGANLAIPVEKRPRKIPAAYETGKAADPLKRPLSGRRGERELAIVSVPCFTHRPTKATAS
jgi:hypothetical protein